MAKVNMQHHQGLCPHCRHSAVFQLIGIAKEGSFNVAVLRCPGCSKSSVWRFNVTSTHPKRPGNNEETVGEPVLLDPSTGGRSPAPPEVEQALAEDYNEACAVLQVSPQSAAALARRILQAILVRKVGMNRRENLVAQINAATSIQGAQAIPAYITDNLHTVRETGNLSAHEGINANGDPVRPNVAEATFALDVIVELFEHFYVAPATAAAHRAQIQAKKNSKI